jgi:hypothetical protein
LSWPAVEGGGLGSTSVSERRRSAQRVATLAFLGADLLFGHLHAHGLGQLTTASTKLMPRCSVRKRMASPLAPQPKQ